MYVILQNARLATCSEHGMDMRAGGQSDAVFDTAVQRSTRGRLPAAFLPLCMSPSMCAATAIVLHCRV